MRISRRTKNKRHTSDHVNYSRWQNTPRKLPSYRKITGYFRQCLKGSVWISYHLRATLIGVVRHDVKMSAGSSGFIGSNSPTSHAASWIQSLEELTTEFSEDSSTPPLHTREPWLVLQCIQIIFTIHTTEFTMLCNINKRCMGLPVNSL